MSCGCNNGIPDDRFDHMRYMRQFPTHQYCSCHHDEPLFMPFQPPPWMGPCMPPPPRQAGPWEYTPSHMYPAPPPCGGYGLPHIPPPYQCQCHNGHAEPRFNYMCMPQQAPSDGHWPGWPAPRPVPPFVPPPPCGCSSRPIYPNPIGQHPGIPSMPVIPPPPDPPEFGKNPLTIINAVPDETHFTTIVKYADGRYDVIPNGYVPVGADINNGPKCWHADDVRGNISDSEGLDTVNFQFNTSDAGSNF